MKKFLILFISLCMAFTFSSVASAKWPYQWDSATQASSGGLSAATTNEINTGTSVAVANTPDALAGSYAGTKSVILKAFDDATAVTTGDGKVHFRVPPAMNGMNLVGVALHIYTTSSSGDPTCQIHNLTDTSDMLSTALSVDATEYDSSDATTPAVIDTAEDDVVTGDILQIDVDTAGTGTKGFEVTLEFRLP